VRARHLPILWVTVACLACGAASPKPRPLAACPLPDSGTATAPWRLVRGNGFTFCLPPGWGPSSGGAWAGVDGVIKWAQDGRPISFEGRQSVEVIRDVPVSELPRLLAEARQTTPCPVASPRVETIDGRTATLRSTSCNGAYNTSAHWSQPILLFAGIASSQRSAEVHFAIYRTVRF